MCSAYLICCHVRIRSWLNCSYLIGLKCMSQIKDLAQWFSWWKLQYWGFSQSDQRWKSQRIKSHRLGNRFPIDFLNLWSSLWLSFSYSNPSLLFGNHKHLTSLETFCLVWFGFSWDFWIFLWIFGCTVLYQCFILICTNIHGRKEIHSPGLRI
jgi:hypothetical protein